MRSYLKWKWYFPSEVTSFRRWLFRYNSANGVFRLFGFTKYF